MKGYEQVHICWDFGSLKYISLFMSLFSCEINNTTVNVSKKVYILGQSNTTVSVSEEGIMS
jgi:hypothetical protein